MKVLEYELKRYRTIVENEAKLRKETGVEKAFYAAHNAQALEEAKMALLTGEIRTPSLPSNDSHEGTESNGGGMQRSTSETNTTVSSGEEYAGESSEPDSEGESSYASQNSIYAQSSFSIESEETDYEDSIEESSVSARKQESSKTSSSGMRGGASVPGAEERMGNPRNSSKSGEGFVPWKEPSAGWGRQGTAIGRGSELGRRTKKQGMPSAPVSKTHRSTSISSVGRGSIGMASNATGISAPEFLPSPSSPHDTPNVVSQHPKPPRSGGKSISRGGSTSASLSHWVEGEHKNQSVEAAPSRKASSTSQARQEAHVVRRTADIEGEIFDRTGEDNLSNQEEVQSPIAENAQRRRSQLQSQGHSSRTSVEAMNSQRVQGVPSLTRNRVEDSLSPEVLFERADDEEEEDGYEEGAEVDGEDGVQTVDRSHHAPTQDFSFYNSEREDHVSANSEEEDHLDAVQERNNEEDNLETNVQAYVYDDESTKRRERRQAQAAREREGNRRRKEGLRRNYLLVDEFTMKPYGVGVGDWRKELMLLSRELDPAIGNINQQPEGAVAQLGIRIQDTWEYSAPMKFAYVKEVVARGVTLRRAELWKRLRNNEEKLEKVSDRSWKSLERQMQSPAAMKKSENCSRANSSRVNFGRTGPSGEVGVRKRLRRKLHRSPDPEEIREEMARDKGYGGRSASRKRSNTSIYGIGSGGALLLDDVGAVSSLSVEQVAQHPLVLNLMQRLEALEGRQTASLVSSGGNSEVEVPDRGQWVPETTDGRDSHEVEEGGDGMQLEGNEGPRRAGRPKKKGK